MLDHDRGMTEARGRRCIGLDRSDRGQEHPVDIGGKGADRRT